MQINEEWAGMGSERKFTGKLSYGFGDIILILVSHPPYGNKRGSNWALSWNIWASELDRETLSSPISSTF